MIDPDRIRTHTVSLLRGIIANRSTGWYLTSGVAIWLAIATTGTVPVRGAFLPTDTLTADSLIFVDSSQPRVRGGFFAGPAVSTAHLIWDPLDAELGPGYFGGIRTELEFAHPLYFLLELEIFNRGLYTTPNQGGSITDHDFLTLYLQFPLIFQVHFPFDNGPILTTGVGAVPGIVLSRKQILRDGAREATIAIDSGLQNFDFGVELRFGSQWSVGSHGALSVDFRYLLGLQNILILASRDDPRVWQSRTLGLSIGWIYQLQRPIYRE